jgi:hypothetical protein
MNNISLSCSDSVAKLGTANIYSNLRASIPSHRFMLTEPRNAPVNVSASHSGVSSLHPEAKRAD